MTDDELKAACTERLKALYPAPYFTFWGIGVGVHCGEAMACVRPMGDRAVITSVSDSLPLAELLTVLNRVSMPPLSLDRKCQCGHKRGAHYDYQGLYCLTPQCECEGFLLQPESEAPDEVIF